LPAADFWKGQSSFENVFDSTLRLTIAGLVAYLLSQFHDVWAFNFWKKLTKGKYLWLRNNASTIVSQAIDAVVFMTIAYYGVFPVIPLIIGQYTGKLVLAILDTPVVYGIVYLARRNL